MPENHQNYQVNHCTAIILAAGQSSRLGKPKQLLQYQGKSLLQQAIDAAKCAAVQSVIVVLGSGFDLMVNHIDCTGLDIIKNENWHTGIASSIGCGINALQKDGGLTDAAILMVCDQPFVSASLLDNLLAVQKTTGQPIVVSKYADTMGTPALFHQSFFPQLLELTGDSGARKIIHLNLDSVAAVPFPQGTIDMDTLGDYKALRK